MPEHLHRSVGLITGLATFGLVFSLWVFALTVWWLRRSIRKRIVKERLGLAEQIDAGGGAAGLWMAPAKHLPGEEPPHASAARSRYLSGSNLVALLGAAALGALVFWFSANAVLAASCGLVVIVVVTSVARGRAHRQQALFEKQLSEALELAVRSLRAGHPLLGAFRLVSTEMAPPVGAVFTEMCQRHSLGASLEEALQQVARHSPSPDMKLFAASVIIQTRIGGNLADMIERLVAVIRDRMKLQRRVRILSAQTQLSKRILLSIPVAVFLALNVISPEYLTPLYASPAGQIMLGGAVASLAVGALMMNRMAVLHY
ncbi:MAG: type II secretion system F family protein [Planctomycetota bacterium]